MMRFATAVAHLVAFAQIELGSGIPRRTDMYGQLVVLDSPLDAAHPAALGTAAIGKRRRGSTNQDGEDDGTCREEVVYDMMSASPID